MKTKKSLVSFLLLFVFLCQFIIPTIVRADIGYTDNTSGRFPTDYTEIDGIIRNYRNQPIEYDEAFVSKTASKGEKDGEFYIDLKIQGKELKKAKKKDIVIVLDNSNSMRWNGTTKDKWGNPLSGAQNGATDRVTAANNAIIKFMNNLKAKLGTNVRFALVTYGSDIFDGRTIKEFYFKDKPVSNYTVKDFTDNIQTIKNKLPKEAPKDIGNGPAGATFTQAALRMAADILENKSSPDNERYIVHLTDGTPTRSYLMTSVDTNGIATFNYGEDMDNDRGYGEDMDNDRGDYINKNIKGDGKAYELSPIGSSRYNSVPYVHKGYEVYDASTGGMLPITNHGRPTLYEARNIVNKYQTFTVGVELTDYTFKNEGYATTYPAPHTVYKAYAVDLMERMSTSKSYYYDADHISKISTMLDKIATEIYKTVQNGSVSDPMGDMVDLNLNANLDGNKFYKLTASNPSLLNGVEVKYDKTTRTISMTGLTLSKNEWVNLRYKVNLRTEEITFILRVFCS